MKPHDIDVLRGLGEYMVKLAKHPLNLERKKLWYKLDECSPERPMILIHPLTYTKGKDAPVKSMLQCEDEFPRAVELDLRNQVYCFEKLRDDHVIEPYINLKWNIKSSGYGVSAVSHSASTEAGGIGAKSWEPPIKNLDKDFGLLKPRSFSIDREGTLKQKEILEAVFKDVLPVRIHGRYGDGARLTDKVITLVGLENFMFLMYDNPEGIHRLMCFLRNDLLNYVRWLEGENIYSLNNGNDTIGSGSIGYTKFLPQADWKPGDKVRMKDKWYFADAQETVGVSSEMFEEFVLPYIVDVTKNFGRVYHGCCEPLQDSIKVIIKKIRNLKRVSVSPWANEEIMARELGNSFVYSRKPNPTLISTNVFNEDLIRKDLQHTLSVAKDCSLEIIMKDIITLQNQPKRAARWVEIAFEEINKIF